MSTSYEEKRISIIRGSPSPVGATLLCSLPRGKEYVVCDIGACDGIDSVIYSRLWPEATVFAIEAREDNVLKLKETITQFDCTEKVFPLYATLSNCVEEVAFYRSYGESGNKPASVETGNKSSSILRPSGHIKEHPWCKFTEEKVTTVRFDSLKIPKVDFIHMDVQGAEIKVLQGMGKVLDTVTAVFLEVSSMELYEGQPLKPDVINFMRDRGFREVFDSCKGIFKSGDMLWVR